MKMVRTLIWIATFVCSADLFGQDPHFSQFHVTAQLYNPAAAGEGESNYAIASQYRRQWGLAGSGYITQALQGDYAITGKDSKSDRLAAGFLLLNDQSGLAAFKLFSAKGAVAYHLRTSATDALSAGFQFGYYQRSISFDGLAWDSQYNGNEYDPSLPSGENPYSVPVYRGIDVAVGMKWKHTLKTGILYGGYGLRHAGQNHTPLQDGRDLFPLRHSIQLGAMHKFRALWLYGDVLIQRQRGAMEILPGIRGEYRLGMDSRYTDVHTSSAILGGLFYRAGEALCPMVGFEWKRIITASLAYDLPLSKINRITGLGGGPEISIRYSGISGNRRKLSK